MKLFTINICFILIIFSCNISEKKTANIKNTKIDFYAKPDSILLKTQNGFIYITKDTSFKHYDWLNPKFNNTNKVYLSLYQSFKNKKSLNKIQINLPKSWAELFLFKDQYYVFSPSDWMRNENLFLTDTILYHNRSVDPDIELISNYKKINHAIHLFKLYTPKYSDTNNYILSNLKIELLDSNLNIYKWTWSNEKSEIYQKRLFIDNKNVKLFPMIVEDCGNQKCFFPNGGIKFDLIK